MWDGIGWSRIRELEAGAWAMRHNTQLVLSASPTVVDDTIRYTDAQAAVTWQASRAQVGVTAGARSGSRLPSIPGEANAWGGVSIVVPVSRPASLVVAAGSYPLDFTQGFPAGRYVSAGVRLSMGAQPSELPVVASAVASGITRFVVRRVSETEIMIDIRAPRAQSVEITGDLTLWDPEPFKSEGNGRFSITLPMTSGTSEVNVRLDGGAWLVPPGLTVVKDELGAEVGILVAPER
jgi:hypothetical protein